MTAATAKSLQEEVITFLKNDRLRAHSVLFAHRHPQRTPDFHAEIIREFHSTHPRIVCEAFRGAAKSTLGEETVIIGAELGEFKNCLIIGASYDRAAERLESIGHEFETNEYLLEIFGEQRVSGTWTTDKKLLTNGVIIQSRGAGQSLRGVKFHDWRPDFVLIDDLEDEESVRTPQARQEMLRWLYKTLIPALTVDARIRFIGNRLDPDAVIVKVANLEIGGKKTWKSLRFPVVYKDAVTGEDKATWPDLFPLERIYRIRAEYQAQGLFEDFNQEYMCEADAPETKLFRPAHFSTVVKARVRKWEATWAMVDPARSVGKRSATTAIPVWSWINNRLIVWDCFIGHWLPDEIIDRMFQVDREYWPVAMGVEEDALNQFILQPLRQAMVKHARPLPLRAMSAKRFTLGRGKEDFIKSLQPFFAAGEVEFAKDLPELKAQFLSFPKGFIDGPNALAYAVRMKPGAPMYDEFDPSHVAEQVSLTPTLPIYLAMNAKSSFVTAQLVQFDGRRLNIISDYVEEGDPGQVAGGIVRRIQLETAGKTLKVLAPAEHFSQWSNVGLRAALGRVPIDVSQGGEPVEGREEIRGLLRQMIRGERVVKVSHEAHWTLNAFSGGYCRVLRPGGMLSDTPEENIYSTLMAGLECLCALLRVASSGGYEDGANLRVSADGRTYRSAMVDRRR